MYALAPQTNKANVNLNFCGKKNCFLESPAFIEWGFIVAEHVQTRASLMHDPGSIDAQLTMILEGINLFDVLATIKDASIYDFLSSLLASHSPAKT